jgi:predicted transcriptional regulator
MDSIPMLSQVAVAILDVYRRKDETKLCKETDIIPELKKLNFSKIQIESAIDELVEADMIRSSSITNQGMKYSLTEQGKSYLAGNT